MSPYRTLSRKFSAFTIAQVSVAVAVGATVAVAPLGAGPAAAAPAASAGQARPASVGATQTFQATASPGRVLLASATSIGGSGSGKPARRRPRTPRQIARAMMRSFRWPRRQFRYLDLLWDRESSWNVHAANPSSGAYGIPQAVPGSKMASAGAHWRSSATTQIRWGLRYIRAVYGSPRAAWAHELRDGWY